MKIHIILITAIAVVTGFSYAGVDEPQHSITLPTVHTELKEGPGQDKAETLCAICHSIEYITMQPNFPRAVWTAEVNKMIKVMGAPINEEDAKIIIDYLATHYGTGK